MQNVNVNEILQRDLLNHRKADECNVLSPVPVVSSPVPLPREALSPLP